MSINDPLFQTARRTTVATRLDDLVRRSAAVAVLRFPRRGVITNGADQSHAVTKSAIADITSGQHNRKIRRPIEPRRARRALPDNVHLHNCKQ